MAQYFVNINNGLCAQCVKCILKSMNFIKKQVRVIVIKDRIFSGEIAVYFQKKKQYSVCAFWAWIRACVSNVKNQRQCHRWLLEYEIYRTVTEYCPKKNYRFLFSFVCLCSIESVEWQVLLFLGLWEINRELNIGYTLDFNNFLITGKYIIRNREKYMRL